MTTRLIMFEVWSNQPVFRITNLQKERTLITAYTVKAMGIPLTRIKMNLYKPFVILAKGVLKPSDQPSSAAVQIPVPQGGIGSWVCRTFSNLLYNHAYNIYYNNGGYFAN